MKKRRRLAVSVMEPVCITGVWREKTGQAAFNGGEYRFLVMMSWFFEENRAKAVDSSLEMGGEIAYNKRL